MARRVLVTASFISALAGSYVLPVQHRSPEFGLRIGSGSLLTQKRTRMKTALRMHGGGHSHGDHQHQHSDGAGFLTEITKGAWARAVGVSGLFAVLPPRSKLKAMTAILLCGFLLAVERRRSLMTSVRMRLSSLSSLYRSMKRHQFQESPQEATMHGDQAKLDSVEATRITKVGGVVNLLLSVFKLFAGIHGHSTAMIADAGHSFSDLISDGVTLLAVRWSRLPPDECHPFGHGRFEALGALAIGALLCSGALSFGGHAYKGMVTAISAMKAGESVAGGGGASLLAISAAVISIVSKEMLYRATERVGTRLNSQVLVANAWHHRSDALSSIVALGGIAGAAVGFPLLDPVAGLIVAFMVATTGLQVGWDSIMQLTDAADPEAEARARHIALSCPGVVEVDRKVRARHMGPQTLIDMKITVDSGVTSSGLTQIIESVRGSILQQMPNVAEVVVEWEENLKVKQCPMLATLRPSQAIEDDVRVTLESAGLLNNWPYKVGRVLVHYQDMQVSVQVFLDPSAEDLASTLLPSDWHERDLRSLARLADTGRSTVLREISDVHEAEVYVSFAKDPTSTAVASSSSSALFSRQPGVSRDEVYN
mmetsp:Transcript_15090/g.20222  ORF Transcript_15090/g.20222 Transcript_15090/m.20222 type:complete len:596 (-) Transcript_15090:119-1906(-)|eukprot:CAMPEP_0185775574 /NCGR_PEP_ID=MMETSP1174-20130828/82498_1 /TAXON_ID=35687 /ORGANISM="Dictyocha speculum, Strain CCMP1381" /LENGTH=595 /DNA_ID=CAMNT_0028463201 /DNA_START=98 /DNA_END=1885 /DNA_ORIENTATION=+